ncbi:PAAR domain-containing protein [Bosea sp. AAP35]|uniref:PAAR domain-containing protein n=1 Tax=Bosea sp. AAP35 TaxID=1523417 RepID=UPI0009E7FF51|nr:PAAR domain-containing protein [Bosea sp. AAP35]
MGMPAARVSDLHTCPMVSPGPVPHVGGPIIPTCSPNVITGGLPQARVTDKCVCVGPIDMIVKGSASVLVNNLPAARIGDTTTHGGVIITGLPTVLIGDAGGGGNMGAGGAAPETSQPCMASAAANNAPFVRPCRRQA